MFKNPSFLFDIVCTVVWLLLAVRYARKGFLASSVQLGGNVFSLVGARVFSGWAAAEVFQRFLAGSFRTQIAESISAGEVVDLTGIADKYAGFLPESFRASIVETCERSISAVLSDNAVVLADVIVQKVLAPLLTPVISVVLFFVAFALLRMLVSMLVTVLGLVITRREKKLAAKKAAYARRQRRRARLARQDATARRLVSTTTANAGHIAA